MRISTVSTDTRNRKQSSLFISVCGMLGKKALFVIVNLGQLMETKIDEPISHMQVCINGWIAISVLRSYSRKICGA